MAVGIAVMLAFPVAAVAETAGDDGSRKDKGGHFAGETLAREAAVPRLRPVRSAGLPFPAEHGHDVSAWQPNVDWPTAVEDGARFVYIKATEDDDYTSSHYEGQWEGAGTAGLYRGSYHFARRFWSDGASQAEYFLEQTHGWKPGARILPPMVDLEHRCTDLTQEWAIKKCTSMTVADNVQWITDFVGAVEAKLGVKPVIYTNASWWREYTGNSTEFTAYPLFIARWTDDVASGPGELPGEWARWTFWQHWDDSSGYGGPGALLPGDQNLYNGTEAALQRFADAAEAMLSIDPAAAAPSAAVTVTGSGFAAGEEVRIEPGDLAANPIQAAADASGAFTTSLTIPAEAPAGPRTVTATGADSGATATAALTIVAAHDPSPPAAPQLTLSTNALQPGEELTVTAHGFAAADRVTASLHSTPTELGRFTAGQDGSLTATVRIPTDTAPGEHTLVLSGASGATVSSSLRIVAAAAPPATAPAFVGVSGTQQLAATGATASLSLRNSAAALFLTGAIVLFWTHRRRAVARS